MLFRSVIVPPTFALLPVTTRQLTSPRKYKIGQTSVAEQENSKVPTAGPLPVPTAEYSKLAVEFTGQWCQPPTMVPDAVTESFTSA